MNVQQILNALPVLQKIMELKLPIKKAHNIYLLNKQINEQKDFFAQEERKMIENFHVEILPNGNLKFLNEQDQIIFFQEHSALMLYEINNLTPVQLTFDDLKDVQISPKELVQLEGVINVIE